MQVKDIFEGIGAFFEATFEILPPLGNIPNYLFIAIGSLLLLFWLSQMARHQEPTK